MSDMRIGSDTDTQSRRTARGQAGGHQVPEQAAAPRPGTEPGLGRQAALAPPGLPFCE